MRMGGRRRVSTWPSRSLMALVVAAAFASISVSIPAKVLVEPLSMVKVQGRAGSRDRQPSHRVTATLYRDYAAP